MDFPVGIFFFAGAARLRQPLAALGGGESPILQRSKGIAAVPLSRL